MFDVSARRRAAKAVALGALVAGLGWLLKISGWAYGLWIVGLSGVSVVATIWPGPLITLASWLRLKLRERAWQSVQGHHHAFGGITLHIESDARYEWLAAADLQRVLGIQLAEGVVQARHSGRWRRDERGDVLLRVDAVVAALVTCRERTDLRIIRLRLYLERQVLFPAAERRRRSSAGPGRE